MLPEIIMIDRIDECIAASEDILRCDRVSVDIEGTNLCRIGNICLIQMRGHNKKSPDSNKPPIYLFDICTLGSSAFEEGGLRQILECAWFEKIMFDCRGDADALFHIFGVRIAGVYDLQVLHTLMFSQDSDLYLKGLKRLLEDFFSSTIFNPLCLQNALCEVEQIKDLGRCLFDPEKGGSPFVWERRPLPKQLQTYAALDVQFLGTIRQTWDSCTNHYTDSVKFISDMRVQTAIDNFEPSTGRYKVFRDFNVQPFGMSAGSWSYDEIWRSWHFWQPSYNTEMAQYHNSNFCLSETNAQSPLKPSC